jgi:oxygen-independent coproporphyrinogen-3 oxidase
VAEWGTKRQWVGYAFSELEQAGYTVTSGYAVVREPKRTRFVYRDSLWQGADLLGLGVASFSHVGGTHFQNEHDFEPYVAKLRQGRLPLYRALTPTPEERLIREIVLQFKLGRISRAYFQRKFGVDIVARFAEPLAKLESWGVLIRDGDWLELSREGLLEVDGLVREFFLPKHRGARYA